MSSADDMGHDALFTRASFGDAEYARIYSRESMIASISNATGAFVWGTVVSVTGSYLAMFGGVIVLMAITCVIVVAIGRAQAKNEVPQVTGPAKASQA